MGFKWTVFVVGACLGSLLSTGCAEGKQEFISKARREAKNQNYEEALKLFNKVLDIEPGDYNALWGIADVHERENNLVKQAAMLEKIMADEALAKDYAGVVKPALETNYNKQGMQLASADPAKAEEFYRKALKINKKGTANEGLFNLLSKTGDNALKKHEYKEASAAFVAASKLRISRKDRAKVKGKAEIADFFAFKAEFMPKFEAMKAALVEEKIYDEASKAFMVEALVELDAKGVKKPDYEQMAKEQRQGIVVDALSAFSWRIAGQERPEGAFVEYPNAVWDVLGQKMERVKRKMFYRIKVAVTEDAVFEQVSKIQKGEFKKAAAPAPAGDAAAPAADPAKPAPAPGK